jgi:hypothetical protein
MLTALVSPIRDNANADPRRGPAFAQMRYAIVLALLAVMVAVPAHKAAARPYRGGIHWSILLCKFSDSPTPPNALSYYNNSLF